MQGVAGPWNCDAGSVSKNVIAAVGPRAIVVAVYQAQVRKPSGHARVHPRENGIVQAVVGTCAQAVGLPSEFPPKNGVTPKLPSEVAQCL